MKKRDNIISFFALIVAVISLAISLRSCQLVEVTNYLHIIPQLEVSYLQNENSDFLVLRNKSPIDIISLSVNYRAYGFDKEQNRYRIVMAGGKNIIDDLWENWIYKTKLAPNKIVSEFLGELSSGSKSPQGKFIVVRVFNIVYYRPSDMSRFEKREIFFLDGGKIYSYNEARKIEKLRNAVNELDAYIRKSYDGLIRLGGPQVKKTD